MGRGFVFSVFVPKEFSTNSLYLMGISTCITAGKRIRALMAHHLSGDQGNEIYTKDRKDNIGKPCSRKWGKDARKTHCTGYP